MSKVTEVVRKLRRVGSQEWRNFWQERPIDSNRVFYESFAGNGMLCNPEAIFRALIDHPEFAHLTHVWALTNEMWSSSARKEFVGHPRVRFVRYRSPQYHRALSTSGFLFNNATFPPEFTKRGGQVYVNTWHGTPLKTMGYDEPGGGPSARNVTRNFLSADYLLAANSFMAERMYEEAYRLTNVYPGQLIIEGSPRVDRQFLSDPGRDRVRRRLTCAGVRLGDDQKLVLYAPTWRGDSFQQPSNDVVLLAQRVRELRSQLPKDRQVLLRVHQQVYSFAVKHPELADILVPNDIPTNEVLGVTDVLVTDYSSIFFDFLATGRPVVFFTPDMSDYDGSRGLYLDPGELPGPVVQTVDELVEVVKAAGSGHADDPAVTRRRVYDEARERFATHEDGAASERVIDIVFRGNHGAHLVRPVRSDGRTRILLYLGGMRSNGIMASAHNLLNNIDHDHVDVSVLYQHSTEVEPVENEAKIHPQVRVIPRIGSMVWPIRARGERTKVLAGGAPAGGQSVERADTLFAQEWRRCLGMAEFDHIVDFSGYAAFWALLLLQGPAPSHSIWLHNDLKADQMRKVDGRRPHEANLGSVFNTYARYDHLVSVSEALMQINMERLADAAPRDKHTFAHNTIDAERITRAATGDLALGGSDSESPDWPLRTVNGEVIPVDGSRAFVTVGRLSPEKNHERLIRAFRRVHHEDPNTRLIIIGGGPLEGLLARLAKELGLGDAVSLAGQRRNPYEILADADVFVLSSDYEGQPMVILEARVLGLPIVATDFASVAGALPPGVGLVVRRDEAALADGMRAALRGEVTDPGFDATAYNAEAMREFYRALNLPVPN